MPLKAKSQDVVGPCPQSVAGVRSPMHVLVRDTKTATTNPDDPYALYNDAINTNTLIVPVPSGALYAELYHLYTFVSASNPSASRPVVRAYGVGQRMFDTGGVAPQRELFRVNAGMPTALPLDGRLIQVARDPQVAYDADPNLTFDGGTAFEWTTTHETIVLRCSRPRVIYVGGFSELFAAIVTAADQTGAGILGCVFA